MVLINSIKLCGDKVLEEGDKYFLISNFNNIDYKIAEILHIRQYVITSIGKKFIDDDNLICRHKVKKKYKTGRDRGYWKVTSF